MYNDCTFIGNLGNDPETKASANAGTSFTNFSIAVNKPGADKDTKPLWVNVTAFGKAGEFVGKYLKKGSKVLVQGALEVQEYEGKDGKNHTSVKLLAGKVVSLSSKEAGTNGSSNGAQPVAAAASKVTDDDIPF